MTMSLPIAILACLAGLLLLFWCGNKLVEGAIVLARQFKLSHVFIGVAVVGFGTSLPEMISTAAAARLDKADLALGNIIGSNIANTALVLGAALILAGKFLPRKHEMQEYLLMTLGLWVFSFIMVMQGGIGRIEGMVLLLAMGAYLAVSLKSGRSNHVEEEFESEHALPQTTLSAGLWVLVGLAGLFVGAELVIRGAVTIAEAAGISERVIGLTLVAVGTSLPEIAAALAAARHGHVAMTLGNVAGSNVFNALAAGGVGGLITPLVADPTLTRDLLVMIGFTLAMGYLFITSRPNGKALGIVLVGSYFVYIIQLGLGG